MFLQLLILLKLFLVAGLCGGDDDDGDTCSVRTLLLPSLEAFAIRALLQRVDLFLVEAMAKSADSFMAFFLSIRLMFFF